MVVEGRFGECARVTQGGGGLTRVIKYVETIVFVVVSGGGVDRRTVLFFKVTATTGIYTLSLPWALPLFV